MAYFKYAIFSICLATLTNTQIFAASNVDRLFDSIAKGDLEGVQGLLSTHPELVKAYKNSWPALHAAAAHGRLEIAAELIGAGADANQERFGSTPLIVALEFEHTNMANFLWQHTSWANCLEYLVLSGTCEMACKAYEIRNAFIAWQKNRAKAKRFKQAS